MVNTKRALRSRRFADAELHSERKWAGFLSVALLRYETTDWLAASRVDPARFVSKLLPVALRRVCVGGVGCKAIPAHF